VFAGDPHRLVGESYSISLKNRSHRRIKVVLGIDGVNVFRKKDLFHTAKDDVGWIIGPEKEIIVRGWQVSSSRAERFVFSPSEWSEGEGTGGRIGEMLIDVYTEYRPREMIARKVIVGKDGQERVVLSGPPSRAPVGTTSGENVDSGVRTVRFTASSPRPDARARIVYGRKSDIIMDRLGIRVRENGYDQLEVTYVVPSGKADEAGIREGDILVKVDTLRDSDRSDLRRMLSRKRAGEYIFLDLRRGDNGLKLKIRL